MDKEWVALIGVVAGGLLTGGISIWNNYTSFARQQKTKVREEYLRHIEEIFDCIDKTENGITHFYLSYVVSIAQGRLDPPKETLGEIPLARLELLISLYCPSLNPPLLELKNMRDKCGAHFVEAVKQLAYKDVQEKMVQLQALTNASKEFSHLFM